MPSLPARDTRLLLATIVVSLLMLLLLARLRFPQQRSLPPEPVSAPLERLAARATYDELAGILRALDRSISDSVVALRLAPDGRLDNDSGARLVPAVRMPDGRALALTGVGRQPLSLLSDRPMTVIASDAPRGLVVLKIADDETAISDWAEETPDLASPGYAAAVEGTRIGTAIRPVYFGRVDQVSDPRWQGKLLRLSGVQQSLISGAAIFTLQGGFVGIGFADDRDFLVVPAPVLRAEADELARTGSVPLAETGIEVQRLDADLRAATGAAYGVIVDYVAPQSAADGVLTVGDVITAVAETEVHSVAEYIAATMNFRPGVPATLTRRRAGQGAPVQITPTTRTPGSEPAAGDLGLELRAAPGGGAEVVRIAARSAASRAGVLAGDVITMLDGTSLPSVAAVRHAYDGLPAGGHLIVGLERGPAHIVVAVTKR